MLLELTPAARMWEEAAAKQAAGDLDEAERLYCELLTAEPDSSDLCLYHLGVVEEARGEFEAAERAYLASERVRLNKLGVQNSEPDQLLLRIRMGIVGVLDELGNLDEAEQLCAEVVADQLLVLGPNHSDTLCSQMTQANFHAAAGRLEVAQRLMQEVRQQVWQAAVGNRLEKCFAASAVQR